MSQSAPRAAIAVFPGSNCQSDMAFALKRFGLEPIFLWHEDHALPKTVTHVILPGGFSFGDHVRAGALAARSPLISAIASFAQGGGRILGVCNGFQILCEAGLLPGVLLKNYHDRFICSVEKVMWFGMRPVKPPAILKLPIAHKEGRFHADTSTLEKLKESGAIAMTYCDTDDQGHGLINGSLMSIAGIIGGPGHNILGLMPHPERALEKLTQGCDGLVVLNDFLYG